MAVKPNAIVDKGGNKLVLLQLVQSTNTWTNATLTVETYLFDVGYLASSSVAQTASKQDFEAEDGEVVATSFSYQRMTTGVLMQTDAALINLLGHLVKGNVYLEAKYTGYVNDDHQWIFKPVRVTPQYAVTRPGGTNGMPYESTGIKLNADLTISAALLASINNLLTLSNFPTATVTIEYAYGFEVVEV